MFSDMSYLFFKIVESDPSFVGLCKEADIPKKRGFARAAAAEYDDDLSLVHMQVNAIQHLMRAVAAF